jgi:chromosome segregation ATPase
MGGPSVDAGLWAEECGRLAPQLLLRVTWQQLTWRHRVALVRDHAPAFEVHLPAIRSPLEALAAQQQSCLTAVAPLKREHEMEAAAWGEANEQVGRAQRRIETLSKELTELEDAIETTKRQGAAKGNELSGSAPLTRIRSALKTLKADTKALALREAFLLQQLASKRASAQSERVHRGQRPQQTRGTPIMLPGNTPDSDAVDLS